jgi:DNA polymerase (family 10)
MEQQHVSAIFDEIANLLELRRDDPFRIRAYRRAAQTLLSVDESLQAVAQRGALEDIPGIGKTLASEINELLDTGHLRYHDLLKSAVPEGLPALLRLPSLTTRQVRALWQQHRITSLKQLAQAYRADRIPLDAATLAVLGRELGAQEREENRMLLGIARPRAEALAHNLAQLPTVQRTEISGSIRRGAALVGDINIVMGSKDPESLMRYCRSQPEVTRILDSGATSTVMLISEGLRVSLVAVPPARFAGALLLGTGSDAHFAALQQRAQRHGWQPGEHAAAEEADLYDLLGLPFIAPELREARGEVEAAEADNLPRLVSQQDVLGDFRVGSHWGDGANGLDQIAQAARKMGYQYVAICDAAYSAATGRGLGPGELAQQIASIELMNAVLPDDFRLLAGVEVDLSPDGDLQAPAELLRACDVVVAAARTSLKEPRRQLTRRLCKAMENPLVHILAPPPRRHTGDPEMPPIDMEAVLDTAATTHTCLEINSHPLRPGLPDVHVRRARDRGVMLTLGSGAQRVREMPSMALGVTTARRGWAEPRHLLNTRPLPAVLQFLNGNPQERAPTTR